MKRLRKICIVCCMIAILMTQDSIVIFAQETDDTVNVTASEATSDNVNSQTPFVEQRSMQLYRGVRTKILWMNLSEDAIVTYFVENTELLTVSEDGWITTLDQEGSTRIRACVMQDGASYEEVIEVAVSGNTDTGLSLPSGGVSMGNGDIFQLSPQLIPEDAADVITYSVSGPAIVTVDQDGVIQANSYGMTDVVASLANGSYIICNIQVGVLAESIDFTYIDGTSITLAKKQSRVLDVTVNPDNASVKQLEWSSSNKSVAEVDKNGKVTGIKQGTTVITAATTDGSDLKVSIKVKVKARRKGTHYSEKGLKIVSTNHQKYTYKEMVADIEKLQKKYGEVLSYKVVGKSFDNRNIYQLTLGNPNAKKVVVIQASIHAREYMTAQLAMKQIEFYCANYYTGTYNGTYFSELFQKVCFKIVPMANPDGVTISQYGPMGIRNSQYRNKVKKICKRRGKGRHSYYTRWKANARGVDLNRNFDAYWKILSTNTHAPSGSGYKGAKPVSEKESKTLVRVVNAAKPTAVISYHAMGQILYWDFGQKGTARKKELALLNAIRRINKYAPVYGYSKYSSTGFGDWVAIKKKLPTVTIEIGSVSCPLPKSQFSSVWKKNKLVIASTAALYD